MSGVIVDVDTRATAANRDLQELNKNLAKLIKQSTQSNSALGDIKTNSFKNVNTDLNKSLGLFKKFETTGKSSTQSVTDSAQGLNGMLGSVRNSVILLTSAFLALKGVGAFNKAADDLTNLQNRLKLTLDDAKDLVKVQTQLYRVSRDTRSSFADTANIYGDFARSIDTLGVSQDRIMGVVKTIQQSAALSGSSTESIKAAMMQLSQGVSSGTLRGEELNSVLEQMKYLGNALTREFKGVSGGIRKFAEEGRLTEKVLFASIEKIAKKTQDDFNKTSTTVEVAAQQLQQSISLFFGEFNHFFNFSGKFAKRLLWIATEIDNFGLSLRTSAALLRQQVSNYIREFDMFDALELTVRALLRFEISPLDAYGRYNTYKQIKAALKEYREGVSKEDLKLLTELKVVFSVVAVDSGNSAATIGDRMKKFGNLFNAIAQKSLEAMKSNPFTDFFVVIVERWARLIPVIRGPLQTINSNIKQWARGVIAEFDALVYDAVMPFGRAIEKINEIMTGFYSGDNRLERAWVGVFKSDSVIEFTKRLKELNEVRRTIKYNSLGNIFKEISRFFKPLDWWAYDILVKLDLVNNSLFRMRDARLDRLIAYFASLGAVTKRVYQDVFATTIEPIVKKIGYSVQAMAETLFDVISDSFDLEAGRDLAKRLVRGIVSIFSKFTMPDLNFKIAIEDFKAARVLTKFKRAMIGLKDFAVGFFVTLGKETLKALSDSVVGDAFTKLQSSVRKAFNKIREIVRDVIARIPTDISDIKFSLNVDFGIKTLGDMGRFMLATFERIYAKSSELLGRTEDVIFGFAKRIKHYFWSIYDEVVGHSFWPDTIDGVVDYTSKIFKSESILEGFAKRVKALFLSVFENVSADIKSAIKRVMSNLADIRISDITAQLKNNIGGAIVAVFAALSSFAPLNYAAYAYFSNLFSGVTLAVTRGLGPMFADLAGTAIENFTSNVVSGLVHAIDLVMAVLPGMIAGFLKALNPLPDGLSSAFGSVFNVLTTLVPGIGLLIKNNLIYGVVAATAALSVFSKTARKVLGPIVLGTVDKKTGNKKTEGVVDFVKALVPNALKANNDIAGALFAKPAFAAAAAVAFASAMLDSVSMAEATQVGGSLLLFAFLGKDGGAAVIKEIFSVTELVLSTAYKRLFAGSKFLFGADSLIAKTLGLPFEGIDIVKKMFKRDPAAVKTAGGVLFGDIKQMLMNLKANSEGYAEGKFGLAEALLTKRTKRKSTGFGALLGGEPADIPDAIEEVDIAASLRNFFKPFTETKINNKTIGEYFTSARAAIKRGSDRLTAWYDNNNVRQRVIDFGKDIFAKTTAVFNDNFALLKEGLSAMWRLATSKLGIALIIAAGFASAANAASDASTAISTVGTNLAVIGKTVAVLTAGFIALGVAMRASAAFEATYKAAKSIRAGVIDRKSDMALYSLRKVIGEAGLDKIYSGAISPIGAAFLAVKSSVADSFSALTAVAKGALETLWIGAKVTGKAIVSTFKISSEAVSSLRSTFGGVASALVGLFVETDKRAALMELGSELKGLGKAFGGAFKEVRVNGAAAIGAVFEKLSELPGLMTKLKGIFIAFGTTLRTLVIAPLWLMIAPFIKIAAIATAIGSVVGLLGLHFFGPDDTTFFGKLEYAYDKIRAIFGLEAKSSAGRFSDIRGILAPKEVGTAKVDLRNTIDTMQIESMTEQQYAVFKSLAEETSATFENLNKLYIKQGFLTEAQIQEKKKAISDFEDIVARQPQDQTKTATGKMLEYIVAMGEVDNSQSMLIKRALGLSETTLVSAKSTNFFVNIFDKAMGVFGAAISSVMYVLTPFIAIIKAVAWTFSQVASIAVDAFAGAAAGAIVGSVVPVIGTAFGAIVGALATSVTGLVARIWQHFSQETFDASNKFFSDWGDNIIGGFQAIMLDIEDWLNSYRVKPSKADEEETAQIVDITSKVQKNFDVLPKEMKDEYMKALDGYTKASLANRELRERGYKPGEGPGKDKNLADYNKKLADSRENFQNKKGALVASAMELGRLGEQLALTKELDKYTEKLAASSKDSLNLDFGAKLKDFLANEDDALEYDRFVNRVAIIDREFLETRDLTERKALLIKRKSIQAQAAERKNLVEAFSTDLGFNTKIAEMFKVTPDFLKSSTAFQSDISFFEAKAEAISSLEARIKTLGRNAPELQILKDQLSGLYAEVNKRLIGGTWMADLNQQLKELNLPEVNVKLGRLLSDPQKQAIANATAETRTKSGLASADGLSTDERNKRLAEFTKESLKTAKLVSDTQVEALKGLDPKSGNAAALISEVTGQAPSGEVTKSASKLTKFNKLTVQQYTAEQRLAQLRAEGSSTDTPVKIEEMAKLGVTIEGAKKSLEKLNEVFSFDSFLSSLSSAGIELDKITFSGLEGRFRNALVSIGAELDSISKQFSEGFVSGAAFDSLMARQQSAIKSAQAIVLKSFRTTGTKVFEIISGLGVELSERMSTSTLKGLLKGQREVASAELFKTAIVDVDNEDSLAKYLEGLKKLTAAQLRLKHAAEDANQSFKTRNENMSASLGTSLSDSDFSKMDLTATFQDNLKLFRRELDSVVTKGETSGGQTAKAFFAGFDKVQRQGALVTFGQELGKSLVDTATEGIKSGFERIKAALPELTADFNDYSRLGGPTRRRMAADGAAITGLQTASELPNLTPALANVLEKFTAGAKPTDVLEEFKTVLMKDTGKTLADAVNTATEPMLDAVTGEPITPVDLSSAFFTALSKYREMKTADTGSLLDAGNSRKELMRLAPDLNKRAVNLSSSDAKDTMMLLAKARKETAALLETASAGDAGMLQEAVDYYDKALQEMTDNIVNKADSVRNAGEVFVSSITNGFSSAFRDFVTGKADDDKGIFVTFLDSLLDTFTNSVVDSFVNGLLDPITGSNGIMTKMMKSLGESIFQLAQSAGSGGSSGGGFGSLLGFVGSLFGGSSTAASPGSAGWGMDLGHATGGYIRGPGTGTSDSIPAFLSNKEFVVNAKATSKFLPLLHAINTDSIGKYAHGGLVGGSTLSIPSGDSTSSASSQQVFNINITGDISRQTKSEIYKMMPGIAAGVNQHNREKA